MRAATRPRSVSGSSPSAPAPLRDASAAPARSLSPTSATSSSRKNGLPPLRSSSASRTSSGDVAGHERVEQLAGGRPVERVEVDDHRVVATGRRGVQRSVQRLAGGGDEHDTAGG